MLMNPRRQRRDYSIPVAPDGLKTHPAGPWAEQKYRYVGMYAEMFATGMKNRWSRRVYLDLFCGPGHVSIRRSKRVLLGSPLVALELPILFDAYIFADEDRESIDTLKHRVERTGQRDKCAFVCGDV